MADDGSHSRDGFYFKRIGDDGDVRIRIRESARVDAPVLRELAIPENEWASIVASVSANGEDGLTWHAVRNFHAGQPGTITFIEKA